MRNKQDVKELVSYFEAIEGNTLQTNEEAILAAYDEENNDQPLIIKILSVCGAFFASLMFVAFLLLAGLYDSPIGLLIFGILLTAGTISLNKQSDIVFFSTVSISCYVIGLTLIAMGLSELKFNENTVCLTFIIIAVISLIVVQNYMLSFLAVIVINGSVLILFIENQLYGAIHLYTAFITFLLTYLFLNEAKLISINKALLKLYRPVRVALIFSFFSTLGVFSVKGIFPFSISYVWLSSLIIIVTIVYLLSHILSVLDVYKTQQKISVYAVSLLVLLPTVLSPAISGALLVMLLSFLVNYKTGLILSLLTFIYFISQYYYDLSFTLLTKSVILISSGILFIVLYLITHKKLTSNEKE
ncbi:DUF4401 domain-containing protein [Flavobacterium sp. Sd200]|uniref:DUF4401 domain-containing protein n=1 Tax=Flavobacterium sp. Sd200 TaxID=2692211 RepID=UPI0013684ED0|nr:DUF4401 domain-containing protein [Flavobacterium sp. Sd200]MXN92057.1 DUF4401 domain-containing protein [Flavobacterium sp. Sd200]